MKKFSMAVASGMLAATFMLAASAHTAYAASKVDCDAVMSEVNSGKHAKEIAKDLKISTSSVYRCKKKAKEAAKAATKAQASLPGGSSKTAPPAMPAAAASPKAK